jgi:endonuclease/exonuclease/phosphatase (EEP) superfamily protein YafD
MGLLVELERLVSESSGYGPVVIAGDFNAHLGSLSGPRDRETPNQQGILLQQLIDRCELYVVSL